MLHSHSSPCFGRILTQSRHSIPQTHYPKHRPPLSHPECLPHIHEPRHSCCGPCHGLSARSTLSGHGRRGGFRRRYPPLSSTWSANALSRLPVFPGGHHVPSHRFTSKLSTSIALPKSCLPDFYRPHSRWTTRGGDNAGEHVPSGRASTEGAASVH